MPLNHIGAKNELKTCLTNIATPTLDGAGDFVLIYPELTTIRHVMILNYTAQTANHVIECIVRPIVGNMVTIRVMTQEANDGATGWEVGVTGQITLLCVLVEGV